MRWKTANKVESSRCRTRSPLMRKIQTPPAVQDDQMPIVMLVPLTVLDQTLLRLVQGPTTSEGISVFQVLPLIVVPGQNPFGKCPDNKFTIMPDDRLYGRIVGPAGSERLETTSVTFA